MNKRKRLLRLDKLRNNNAHCAEIKQLSLEIREHLNSKKRAAVNRAAIGPGIGNIWRAVKIAKNILKTIVLYFIYITLLLNAFTVSSQNWT